MVICELPASRNLSLLNLLAMACGRELPEGWRDEELEAVNEELELCNHERQTLCYVAKNCVTHSREGQTVPN
jgi:hypothetical protein